MGLKSELAQHLGQALRDGEEGAKAAVTVQLPAVQQMDGSARAVQAWAGDRPAYASNLATDSDEYQQCALAFVGESDSRAEEQLSREIKIVGVLAGWRVLGVRPDGQVDEGMACVLLTEHAETISITANGPVRVLGEILRQRGPGEWNPPVSVWIKAVPLGDGKRRFSLTAKNVRRPK